MRSLIEACIAVVAWAWWSWVALTGGPRHWSYGHARLRQYMNKQMIKHYIRGET